MNVETEIETFVAYNPDGGFPKIHLFLPSGAGIVNYTGLRTFEDLAYFVQYYSGSVAISSFISFSAGIKLLIKLWTFRVAPDPPLSQPGKLFGILIQSMSSLHHKIKVKHLPCL
jgi:hypothetical protein